MEKKEKSFVEVEDDQLEKMTKIIEDLSIQIEDLTESNKEKDAIIKKLQLLSFLILRPAQKPWPLSNCIWEL